MIENASDIVIDFEIRRLLITNELRAEGVRGLTLKTNLLETLARGYLAKSKVRTELTYS